MNLAALLGALALDGLLGDPPGLPHPVSAIGRFIRTWDDALDRQASPGRQYAAGALGAVATVFCAASIPSLLTAGAFKLHPALGWVFLLYFFETALAGRCLTTECLKVARLLDQNALPEARQAVGWLVGRDTAELTSQEVAAATVETLAENTSDGVTAPLFWATVGLICGGLIGALAGAWAYKGVNTLDSTVGYRNDKYRYAGRFSAKLDDGANWIPARLTALLFVVSAFLLGEDWRQAAAVLKRDHGKHLSPNAGWPESAMAGALNVTLGGGHFYGGHWVDKPTLGGGDGPLDGAAIRRACRFLLPTTVFTALLLAPWWL